MQLLYKWLLCFGLILNCTSGFASTNGAASAGSTITKSANSNNQTALDFNDLVKKADAALVDNHWQPVINALANFKNFTGNTEQTQTLQAIKRQADHAAGNKSDGYEHSDEFQQDQQKIRMAAFY